MEKLAQKNLWSTGVYLSVGCHVGEVKVRAQGLAALSNRSAMLSASVPA